MRILTIELRVVKKGEEGGVEVKFEKGSFDTEWGISHNTQVTSAHLERHSAEGMFLKSNQFFFKNNVAWDNNHTFSFRLSPDAKPLISPIGTGFEFDFKIEDVETVA